MTEQQAAELLVKVDQTNTHLQAIRDQLTEQHAAAQLGLSWLFLAVCCIVFFVALDAIASRR